MPGSLAAMSGDAEVWRPPAAETPRRARVVASTGRGAADRLARTPEGQGRAGVDHASQRRRYRNGMAIKRDMSLGWWQRNVLRSRRFWVVTVMTLIYGGLVWMVYRNIGDSLIAEVAAVTEEAYGTPTKLTWPQLNEAFITVSKPALITLGVYVVALIAFDRLRPTTWSMKWLALGWGGAVAIFVSLHVNTWAGELMKADGPVDAATSARAAIYSAPFVEEAAKATVLFWLAVWMRRRIAAMHQMVTLAALSALGFAFCENIVYYVRTYMYAVSIYQTDADAELSSLVLLRGVLTSFGHPLFTTFTALGLIVALSNRSKFVRVLAPAAGYLMACFGHMAFNGFATVGASSIVMAVVGWGAVLALTIYSVLRYVTQVRTIKVRLTEFVHMGWLEPSDPVEFSKFFGRWRMALCALLRGPRTLAATLHMQRVLTELAYLRGAELRGLVDAMAIERERELVIQADQARSKAVCRTKGVPVIPETWGPWIKAQMSKAKAWRMRRRQGTGQQLPPPVGVPVAAGAWAPPRP